MGERGRIARKPGFRFLLFGTAQQGTHPCQQLQHAEGLGHIVVCAPIQSCYLVVFLVLRRQHQHRELFDCGTLHLDLETREVKVNGREVLLTYKEYELLVYLAENQNRVVSRDELLDKLWDWRADVETRTLDIHIKTLRQKLGEEAGHYIKTVRSVGYRFMKPQE